MTEPWFNPNQYAWIPGTLVGVLGGMEGVLIGAFASKGKHRTLVTTMHFMVLLVCLALLVTGVVALLRGQPYGIWYGFGLPGLLGLIIFGSFTGMIRKRYTEAELRKSMGEDL